MEKTLQVLNQMQVDGVIGRYAVGGAVAAFFYIEPGTTYDLDVFMLWEPAQGGLLDMGPIYNYLLERGHRAAGESIEVEGWPVQFLPSIGALTREALDSARAVTVGQTETRIFTQEHLMAICLETGRPKDMARLLQFVEEGDADQETFHAILQRHGLTEKWTQFQTRFNLNA